MRRLFVDYETFSSAPIGEVGSFRYMQSPDFRVLLLAYAFDDDPVKVIDIEGGEPWPQEFLDAVTDENVVKVAHNAAFERYATYTAKGLYCPPEQWLDTMVMAGVCGLPMSLDSVGKALGLPEDQAKMKEGKALIRYFCQPTVTKSGVTLHHPEDAPDRWAVFKAYNRRDVETERTIFHILEQWLPDETEHRFWCLDARINENGMNTDAVLVENAIAMDRRYKAELLEEAARISGLGNPNSTAQVKAWLLEQEGIEAPSLNKKEVADVVAKLSSEEAKRFMALRTEFSKSSTKKYEAIQRNAGPDNHIRGCFQFYGAARTGRFAGRLVQLQNLPQNKMDDLDAARALVRSGDYATLRCLYENVTGALSELIRTAMIPEDGCKFIVADYSAIEARVTAWIAGETWRQEVFAKGGDIYCMSASQMFHVPVEKHGVNGHLRQKGKVAELACGYGGGPSALKAFGADKMGMSEEEMAETVAMWREASPHIVQLWSALEKAAARCAAHGTPQVSTIGNIRFEMERGILWMTLPSGRRIAYYGAKYEEGTGKFSRGRKVLSYMGQDQKTKKWARLETWGGKLTENLVQATARDCLRETMLALEKNGYDIRAHVHDEVIISEPIGGRSCKDVCEIMGRPIPWAPGLLLRGDGYECSSYRKD